MPGDASLGFTLRNFVYNQFFGKLPQLPSSFAGRTVIVTGSNVGLGFEAAQHIAGLGASKVILAVRSVDKGIAAKETIEESTKCDPSVIEVWPFDLGSYDSVKTFAARVFKDLPRLDVLLENAGVATRRWKTAEDNELTLTVNVVSTFLLAFLLLPKMKETALRFHTRPNLSVVTSEMHYMLDFNERLAPEGIFNNLNDESKANMNERYPISKLLEVYIVREMAARCPVDTYSVTINMLNPGLCKSELAREGYLDIRIMKALLARTTEQGSRTLVHAAGAGPETHGGYLDCGNVTKPATIVVSEEGERTQKRLWGELVGKLEKIVPGISQNL